MSTSAKGTFPPTKLVALHGFDDFEIKSEHKAALPTPTMAPPPKKKQRLAPVATIAPLPRPATPLPTSAAAPDFIDEEEVKESPKSVKSRNRVKAGPGKRRYVDSYTIQMIPGYAKLLELRHPEHHVV